MIKFHARLLLAPAIFALVNCNQTEPANSISGTEGSSNKQPLVFDASRITTPPASLNPAASEQNALRKTAATYYTFSPGNGLSNSDLNRVCTWSRYDFVSTLSWQCDYYEINGAYQPLFPSAGGSYTEATYSSRIASTPEDMWVSNGRWLQAGTVLDNEQVEQHLYAINTPPYSGTGPSAWSLEVEYEINTELNYDWVYITSTGPYPGCNNPGVIRKQMSGVKSGREGIFVDRQCPNIWVGVYYIKDYSVTASNEYVRTNISFGTTAPVGKTAASAGNN